jgi:hypothetical protein
MSNFPLKSISTNWLIRATLLIWLWLPFGITSDLNKLISLSVHPPSKFVWAGCSLRASHIEKAHFRYVLYVWTKLFNKILYRFEYYIIASPSRERELTEFLKTGLYTIVTPSTSPLPTPLERRHEGIHESSWVDVLFQYHFSCCQVCIKMCLGPI